MYGLAVARRENPHDNGKLPRHYWQPCGNFLRGFLHKGGRIVPSVAPAPHPRRWIWGRSGRHAGWVAAGVCRSRAKGAKTRVDLAGESTPAISIQAPGSGRGGHVLGVLFDLNQRVIALVRSDMEIG